MIKLQKDLVKGDVIRVEYGDYDNWVVVTVESIEENGKKIVGRFKHNEKIVEMYGGADSSVEVL